LVLAAMLIHALPSLASAPTGSGMARVIVGLRPPPSEQWKAVWSGPALTELVQGYGGRVLDTFSSMSAVSALVPNSALEGLRSRPEVAFVERDEVGASYEETIGWGLTSVHAPEAWSISTGRAVKIAVLDTGIDYDHPDLKDVVKGGVDFTGSEYGYRDAQGHGTHMAGIIAASRNGFGSVGVAYEAELYAVKVLRDSDGWGYYSWWIRGIEWAVENHMQVISMSLGGTTDSQALRRAVDLAYSKGLLIVAAAGNAAEGSDAVLYPARYDSVIAVGAVDSAGQPAGFSRRGPELELVAPGVGIYTTELGGSHVYSSGTSAATPFVAGAAALVWAANGNLTNMELREALDTSAIDLGPQGRDSSYGYGLVNGLRALDAARSLEERSLQAAFLNETVASADRVPESLLQLSLIGNATVVVARGSYAAVSLTVKGAQRGTSGFAVSLSGLPSGVSAKVSKVPSVQTVDGSTLKVVLVAGLSVPSGEYTVNILGLGEGGQNSTLPLRIMVEENSLARSLLGFFFHWSGALSQPFGPRGPA